MSPTLDDWVTRLGEEQPPETFFLDPVARRGALTAGLRSWHRAGDNGDHGCQVAREVARHPYPNEVATPWGASAIAAQGAGGERTALLPWEAS